MMHEQETEGLVYICVCGGRGHEREWIKITSQKYLLSAVVITYAFM
jgi:hypothetical protein